MATEVEKHLQTGFLAELATLGYSTIPSYSKVQDLNQVLLGEVERLNGLRLSEAEVQKLFNRVQSMTMVEAFDALRYGVQIPLDGGDTRTLKFYSNDPNENRFQVVEELTIPGLRNRRLDVIILMNGLPLVAVELKRTGSQAGNKEAIADINFYSLEGTFRTGLLKFIQLYVASDGITTQYWPTSPRVERREIYTEAFYWTDEKNERITRLFSTGEKKGFASAFFDPAVLFPLVFKNMLKTPGAHGEIMVSKPYQFYGVIDGAKRAIDTDDNGYFWHATGSGKTYTSFMLAKAISESAKFSNTVMLLDRKDLADQTLEEYGKFGDLLKEISRGKSLLHGLRDSQKLFSMTTIQSMARLVEKNRSGLRPITQEPICFVVDEAHRSTFGKMFKSIKALFPKSQFMGFTGTPILADNPASGDRLTKDIFGDPIHIYTTKNAIDDGNVLAFQMDEVEIKVATEGIKRDKNYFSHPNRMAEVATYVSTNLHKHTLQRNLLDPKTGEETALKDTAHADGYNAILASQSIADAYKYWELLRPLLASQGRKTTVVFSSGGDKELDRGEGTPTEWSENVLKAYDEDFGTSFYPLIASEGLAEAKDKHLRDVMARIKNRELDLTVVAWMLLTGFDARTLNTIYLDKQGHHHSLLQWMSRTNRTHSQSGKPFGNVVLFSDRDMIPAVDEAVALYSNGAAVKGVVFRKNYKDLYSAITSQVAALKELQPTADSVGKIEEIEDLLDVVKVYSELRSSLTKLRTYDEWSGTQSAWKTLGIGEQEFEEYYGFIVQTRDRLGLETASSKSADLLADLNFAIASIQQATINVAYINDLLMKYQAAPPSAQKRWSKLIYNAMDSSTDPTVQRQRPAVEAAIKRAEAGEAPSREALDAILEEEKEALEHRLLRQFAVELSIEEAKLQQLVDLYSSNGILPVREIGEILRAQKVALREQKAKLRKFSKVISDLSLR